MVQPSHTSHIQKENILSFEDSYKQTQYVSALIISICSLAMFWELEETNFDTTSLVMVRAGFICIFVVFCINIYVIHSISRHVSHVYEIVSGSDRSEQNEPAQTEEAYAYHVTKRKHMASTIRLFRVSLAILVVSVCIIIVSKHSILNQPSIVIIGLATILTIFGIAWGHT